MACKTIFILPEDFINNDIEVIELSSEEYRNSVFYCGEMNNSMDDMNYSMEQTKEKSINAQTFFSDHLNNKSAVEIDLLENKVHNDRISPRVNPHQKTSKIDNSRTKENLEAYPYHSLFSSSSDKCVTAVSSSTREVLKKIANYANFTIADVPSAKSSPTPRQLQTQNMPPYTEALICEDCNKTFITRSGLTQHRQAHHSGPKNFKCNICFKRFATFELRERHAICHDETIQKKFPCNLCPKSYTQKFDLQRHFDFCHGKPKFPCKTCSKGFVRKASLNRHIRSRYKNCIKNRKILHTD